jgi:hypothetical protein
VRAASIVEKVKVAEIVREEVVEAVLAIAAANVVGSRSCRR